MIPKNRKEVAESLLTDLGREFVNVELSPSQIDDIIADCCWFFAERCAQAREPSTVILTVSDADIINGYLTLPDSVMYVTDVISEARASLGSSFVRPGEFLPGVMMYGGGMAGTMFAARYTEMDGLDGQTWSYGPRWLGSPMERYEQSVIGEGIIKLISGFSHATNLPSSRFRYNRFSKRLWLEDEEISELKDKKVLVRVENTFDKLYAPTESVPQFMNFPILGDYMEYSARLVWAKNLSKFGSVTLPGGEQIDFRSLAETYEQKVNDIETSIIETYGFEYGQVFWY